ncbi:MAG: hypothetical protein EA393_16555, partial [Bacteroidetes bacterium]
MKFFSGNFCNQFFMKKMKQLPFRKLFVLILLGNFMLITGCKSQKINPSQALNQSTEYFLKDFVYSGKYLDISNETENARSTYWKPDGNVVFITGRYTDNLAAYRLSEPWQIHTAEFLYEVKLPGEFQHGLYIREDG